MQSGSECPVQPSVQRFVSSLRPPCTWSPARTPASHWPNWGDGPLSSWHPANRWSPAACCGAASSYRRVWSESLPSESEACQLQRQKERLTDVFLIIMMLWNILLCFTVFLNYFLQLASLCCHVVFDYYHWRVAILALSMYTNQYQQWNLNKSIKSQSKNHNWQLWGIIVIFGPSFGGCWNLQFQYFLTCL